MQPIAGAQLPLSTASPPNESDFATQKIRLIIERMLWIVASPTGFTRSELLTLLKMGRDQKNHHQHEMFDFLRLFLPLIAALLAAEIALAAFSIPYINRNVADASVRSGMVALLGILPLTVLGLIRVAFVGVAKAYQKLIEHLTVEQKLEAALGLLGPLMVEGPIPATELFPDDKTLLLPRWINGSLAFPTADEFVEDVVRRTNVIHRPVRQALYLIAASDAALLLTILAYAVVSYAGA